MRRTFQALMQLRSLPEWGSGSIGTLLASARMVFRHRGNCRDGNVTPFSFTGTSPRSHTPQPELPPTGDRRRDDWQQSVAKAAA